MCTNIFLASNVSCNQKRKLNAVNCPVAHALLNTCVVSPLNFIFRIYFFFLCLVLSPLIVCVCESRFCVGYLGSWFLLWLQAYISIQMHAWSLDSFSRTWFFWGVRNRYSIYIISNNFIHCSWTQPQFVHMENGFK